MPSFPRGLLLLERECMFLKRFQIDLCATSCATCVPIRAGWDTALMRSPGTWVSGGGRVEELGERMMTDGCGGRWCGRRGRAGGQITAAPLWLSCFWGKRYGSYSTVRFLAPLAERAVRHMLAAVSHELLHGHHKGIVDGDVLFAQCLHPRLFRVVPRHLAGGHGDYVPRLRQRMPLRVVVRRKAQRQRTAGGKAAGADTTPFAHDPASGLASPATPSPPPARPSRRRALAVQSPWRSLPLEPSSRSRRFQGGDRAYLKARVHHISRRDRAGKRREPKWTA